MPKLTKSEIDKIVNYCSKHGIINEMIDKIKNEKIEMKSGGSMNEYHNNIFSKTKDTKKK